jgi:hypothetical protein
MQALCVGLVDVVKLDGVSVIRDSGVPVMGFEWVSDNPQAQVIACTIAKSLEAVANTYPERLKYHEIR